MKYFNNILSYTELKLLHRRLAMLNHPDIGGSAEAMKNINHEYEILKKQFTQPSNSFNNIAIGDIVEVNKSQCRVLQVTINTFTAKSNFTGREAVFSKTTGISFNNPKFVARQLKNIQSW